MFWLTGPVTRSPSAWRGEATKSMPKRARSKVRVPRTLTSASQALHPPALTWRSRSERPKRRRACSSSASASCSSGPARTRSERRRTAIPGLRVKRTAPWGQTRAHSPQKRQRPRSRVLPGSMAAVGQTGAHCVHPSAHRAG